MKSNLPIYIICQNHINRYSSSSNYIRSQTPTIKISKFLDDLLRSLFDQMASKTTITSGFELVKQLREWSKVSMRQETLFCTVDVADLYTMVPQIEGVLSLKKMLDYFKLKHVGGLKVEKYY